MASGGVAIGVGPPSRRIRQLTQDIDKMQRGLDTVSTRSALAQAILKGGKKKKKKKK